MSLGHSELNTISSFNHIPEDPRNTAGLIWSFSVVPGVSSLKDGVQLTLESHILKTQSQFLCHFNVIFIVLAFISSSNLIREWLMVIIDWFMGTFELLVSLTPAQVTISSVP